MNKLLTALMAIAAALTIGAAVAADNSQSPNQTQQSPTQQEQVPAQGQGSSPGNAQSQPKSDADMGATGNTQALPNSGTANENPEYAAALSKCDSKSGARKTKCINKAKKKFDQM